VVSKKREGKGQLMFRADEDERTKCAQIGKKWRKDNIRFLARINREEGNKKSAIALTQNGR